MLLVFFPTSKVTKEAEILQEGFSLIFIIRKTFTGQLYMFLSGGVAKLVFTAAP